MAVMHEIIIGTPGSRKAEVGELLSQHLGVSCQNSDEWGQPEKDQRSKIVSKMGQIAERSVIVAGHSVPLDQELLAFLKMFGRLIYLDTGPVTKQNPRSEGDSSADAAAANISSEQYTTLRHSALKLADLIIEISQDDTPEAILEKIKERIGS